MADKWAQYAETAPAPQGNKWARYADGQQKIPGMERIGELPGAPTPPLPDGLAPQKPVSIPLRNSQGPIIPKNVPLTGAERKLTAPMQFMANGATQLGRGATRVVAPKNTDDFLGGVADVVQGGGTLALPAAIPAIAAAPGTAMLAAGTGAATGATAKYGSKALGAGEGTSEFLGTAAGLGGGFAGSKIPQAFRPDVRVLATRALRPTPSQPDFSESIPESFASIKQAAGGKNPAGRLFGKKGVTDGELDIIPAARKAIDQHQAMLDKWLARAKGVMVSGDEVVGATRQAIPKIMWERDPKGAQALIDEAQAAFGGKRFSVQDFRDFLRSENADLSAFYNRAPGIQQAAATAGTPPGIQSAQTNRIREVLYRALDPQNGGAGPREIQRRTGDLYEILNTTLRRNNAIVAEQPITRAGEAYDALKSAMRTILPFKPGGTGISYAEGSEGRSLPYLRRAFNNVGEPAPLPQPSGYYPSGNPQRQLGPGSIKTPPPPDQSFVRPAPGMTQPPTTRALPAPRTIITPAPADPSMVRGAPAMPRPPNPRRALPAPGRPPQDFLDMEIGSSFGDRLRDPNAYRPRPQNPPILEPRQ